MPFTSDPINFPEDRFLSSEIIRARYENEEE
jgi:hypothetical protein